MKDFYLYVTNQINPASLLVTIFLDLAWSLPEFVGAAASGGLTLFISVAVIFFICFISVTSVQRFGSHDEWPAALTKGFALGVAAAVPFSLLSIIFSAGWGIFRVMIGAEDQAMQEGKITQGWRGIETILREAAGSELNDQTLEKVINHLFSEGNISSDLKDRLHQLRKKRNVFTHLETPQELDRLVKTVTAMEKELRKKFR